MQRDPKKTIRVASLSVFFMIIFIYAFFRSYDLLFGVKIRNVSLVDGSTTVEEVINVKGVAKNAVFLSLNDREISIDKEGNFDEVVALAKGYNILSIKAKDKFGHSDEKNYKLIY